MQPKSIYRNSNREGGSKNNGVCGDGVGRKTRAINAHGWRIGASWCPVHSLFKAAFSIRLQNSASRADILPSVKHYLYLWMIESSARLKGALLAFDTCIGYRQWFVPVVEESIMLSKQNRGHVNGDYSHLTMMWPDGQLAILSLSPTCSQVDPCMKNSFSPIELSISQNKLMHIWPRLGWTQGLPLLDLQGFRFCTEHQEDIQHICWNRMVARLKAQYTNKLKVSMSDSVCISWGEKCKNFQYDCLITTLCLPSRANSLFSLGKLYRKCLMDRACKFSH